MLKHNFHIVFRLNLTFLFIQVLLGLISTLDPFDLLTGRAHHVFGISLVQVLAKAAGLSPTKEFVVLRLPHHLTHQCRVFGSFTGNLATPFDKGDWHEEFVQDIQAIIFASPSKVAELICHLVFPVLLCQDSHHHASKRLVLNLFLTFHVECHQMLHIPFERRVFSRAGEASFRLLPARLCGTGDQLVEPQPIVGRGVPCFGCTDGGIVPSLRFTDPVVPECNTFLLVQRQHGESEPANYRVPAPGLLRLLFLLLLVDLRHEGLSRLVPLVQRLELVPHGPVGLRVLGQHQLLLGERHAAPCHVPDQLHQIRVLHAGQSHLLLHHLFVQVLGEIIDRLLL
mmetsp:Transcript_53470/g.120494  ORF Transcript_53470/g.120494 Transcript_53470/m.120494 type:complete len:340 (-) Transcript_53470:825-1844(-)